MDAIFERFGASASGANRRQSNIKASRIDLGNQSNTMGGAKGGNITISSFDNTNSKSMQNALAELAVSIRSTSQASLLARQ